MRPAGDDQAVVLERRRSRHVARRRPQLDSPRREIEARDLREQDPDVAVIAEDDAEREADLSRRQGAGRHLIGEGLEQVEVAAVYEDHLDRLPRELQRGVQSTEAAADDDDAVRRALMAPERVPCRPAPRDQLGGVHATKS